MWNYERFAEALLATEVASLLIGRRAARPGGALPCPEDAPGVRLGFARSLKKQAVLHLAQLDFLHARENVVVVGPPGTGRPVWRSRSRSRSGPA